MKKTVTEAYLKRTISLFRAAEGEAVQSASLLIDVNKRIIEEMSVVFEKPTKRKIELLKRSVDKKLSVFYRDQWPEELLGAQKEVITKEIVWNTNLIDSVRTNATSIVAPRSVFLNSAIEAGVSTLTLSTIDAASKKKYQGRLFSQHIKKAFGNDSKRIQAVLRTGLSEGKNIAQMSRDVRSINSKSIRDVKTITRSFFMHNASIAKERVYKLNPDVVRSIIWISTLDSRTTPLICGIRDGQEYTVIGKEPIGHSIPWDAGPGAIHWNCRSSSAPNVEGSSRVSKRPSIGAGENYKRGDNKNSRGKVKKPIKKNREDGTFKIDIKTSRTKYEGWLKDQSRKNIDYVSDILGSKAKAQAFRDGTMTLKQLGAQSPVSRVLNRSQI